MNKLILTIVRDDLTETVASYVSPIRAVVREVAQAIEHRPSLRADAQAAAQRHEPVLPAAASQRDADAL